jgi:hypothetical protein
VGGVGVQGMAERGGSVKGYLLLVGWGYHVVAGVARCCSNGGSLVC